MIGDPSGAMPSGCRTTQQQIGHTIVKGSNLGPVKSDTILPTASTFFERIGLPACAIARRWAVQTRYTLVRFTANIYYEKWIFFE